MAATLNGTPASCTWGTAASSITTGNALTIAAGTNTVLVAGATMIVAADRVNSVTWNTVSGGALSVNKVGTGAASSTWLYVNPGAATAALVIGFSASTTAGGGGQAFDGVDQTTPALRTTTANQLTGATFTITDASWASGDVVAANIGTIYKSAAITLNTGTITWPSNTGTGNARQIGGYNTTSGSVVATSNNVENIATMVTLRPASAATAPLFLPSNLNGLQTGGPFFANPIS